MALEFEGYIAKTMRPKKKTKKKTTKDRTKKLQRLKPKNL